MIPLCQDVLDMPRARKHGVLAADCRSPWGPGSTSSTSAHFPHWTAVSERQEFCLERSQGANRNGTKGRTQPSRPRVHLLFLMFSLLMVLYFLFFLNSLSGVTHTVFVFPPALDRLLIVKELTVACNKSSGLVLCLGSFHCWLWH